MLREAAIAAGLDPSRVDEVLDGREYDDEVTRDVEEGAALGATGVPFFVLDRRFAVSGAQPVEVFAQALEMARSDSAPGTPRHTLTDLVRWAELSTPHGPRPVDKRQFLWSEHPPLWRT